jgi:hypothetical protein
MNECSATLNTCCHLKLPSICKPSKLAVLASVSLSSYPTVTDEECSGWKRKVTHEGIQMKGEGFTTKNVIKTEFLLKETNAVVLFHSILV